MSSLQKTAVDAAWNKFRELILNPYAVQRYYAIQNGRKDAWKNLSKNKWRNKCILEKTFTQC
jgi:hypothetical protein